MFGPYTIFKSIPIYSQVIRKAFFCFNLDNIWGLPVEVFFKCFILHFIKNGHQESDSNPYMSLQAFWVYERNPSKFKTKYTIAMNRVKYCVGKYLKLLNSKEI